MPSFVRFIQQSFNVFFITIAYFFNKKLHTAQKWLLLRVKIATNSFFLSQLI